ncbi:hypothetical protein X798_03197 [Onchocerca flexuosa]|uniref:Uncharacterized protein n=1 Tax=Onchocerca flexuosa TaxID=387005 RepID=A0A238BXN0_9BILA|nr:hypothetical protein X798_03197 [Onchocerca flexuosa]
MEAQGSEAISSQNRGLDNGLDVGGWHDLWGVKLGVFLTASPMFNFFYDNVQAVRLETAFAGTSGLEFTFGRSRNTMPLSFFWMLFIPFQIMERSLVKVLCKRLLASDSKIKSKQVELENEVAIKMSTL